MRSRKLPANELAAEARAFMLDKRIGWMRFTPHQKQAGKWLGFVGWRCRHNTGALK